MPEQLRIRPLTACSDRELAQLSDVLIDCVAGGASVSFMPPLTPQRASVFWRGVAASAACGERVLLVAEDAAGGIIGTVQLILALPENQPHRAEIAKMLVHRRARRHGVGAALLERRRAGGALMFSDLVGSTALSARMDPEDLRKVISAYQKCVAETVRRFGGFVAKYMGDGVLVYFGYPKRTKTIQSEPSAQDWSWLRS